MLRSLIVITAALVLLVGAAGKTRAWAQPRNLGLVMWSAFTCSQLAEMSNNEHEQERLFQIGYAAGEKFVRGIRDKKIPKSEIDEAPVGVLWELSGPTVDFMVGRVFEAASNDAFERIMKKDSAGMPLPMGQWVLDQKTQSTLAQTRFREDNCDLIQ